MQSLDGSDRHVPAADSSLKDDVAGEVETTLDGLWIEHKLKIGGVGQVVMKRISGTMSKARENQHMRLSR